MKLLLDRPARIPVLIACALWLASWFLPVAHGVSGWEAFRYSLSRGAGDADALPQALSALSSVVFLVLAWRALRAHVSRPGLFARVAFACALFDLYWLVDAVRQDRWIDLLIGYYVWIAAFALLALSGVSVRRTSRTPTAGTPA
jgi:hypothetical protein